MATRLGRPLEVGDSNSAMAMRVTETEQDARDLVDNERKEVVKIQTRLPAFRHMQTHTIREVWSSNLREEMDLIVHSVEHYQYIAMDTEFPGTVARPLNTDQSSSDWPYKSLKCNVDLLKIIQLGLSVCDETGQHEPMTWQFNFKFNLNEDMYAQDSIDFLRKSGLDFARHNREGIDVKEFAEVLMMSGVVLSDDVTWITFHSGYDYGYFLKILTDRELPQTEREFFDALALYFPRIYDIKYMMQSCEILGGGLNKLAADLDVERVGIAHQAGSDSLLTAATFFKMREEYFEDDIDEDKFLGILYGLGKDISLTPSAPKPALSGVSSLGGLRMRGSHALKRSVTPNARGRGAQFW